MSKWIKADAVNVEIGGGYIDIDAESFMNAPTIEICFCGECEKWHNGWCYKHGRAFEPNDFCSYGSRSEKPNNSKVSEKPTGSERSSK
jgi:hypothetical protein